MSRPAYMGRTLLAVALALLLGGCITPGPTTRFYSLTPVTGTPPDSPRAIEKLTTAKPRFVVIRDVRLPLYLDRPQIVTRSAGNSLEWSEIDQWGGVLRDDLARTLATNLGRLLEGDRVVAAPYPVSNPPDCRIEVEIRSFERLPAGQVELLAQWWITRGSDGALLGSSEGKFASQPVADGAAYDTLVNAMSAVYGELAQAIARSVQSQVASGT